MPELRKRYAQRKLYSLRLSPTECQALASAIESVRVLKGPDERATLTRVYNKLAVLLAGRNAKVAR